MKELGHSAGQFILFLIEMIWKLIQTLLIDPIVMIFKENPLMAIVIIAIIIIIIVAQKKVGNKK